MEQRTAEQRRLETLRLRLRPLLKTDLPQLVTYAGDREVAANTLTIPHPYEESDAIAFLVRAQRVPADGSEFIFAIAERASDVLVGTCGISVDETHRYGEIGYWIGRSLWNRGYGAEAVGALINWAFSYLDLDKIIGRVFRGNLASSRVLEKIGMEREAILRQHLVKWGERRDVEQWGVLREDWQQR